MERKKGGTPAAPKKRKTAEKSTAAPAPKKPKVDWEAVMNELKSLDKKLDKICNFLAEDTACGGDPEPEKCEEL